MKTNVPNISFVRSEIQNLTEQYTTIDDCLAGQKAIKEKRETYLPIPNPSDKSEENKERYSQYLQRAVFYNVTGRTLAGMVGTVFQKLPEAEIPEELKAFTLNVDGQGVEIEQQAKKALGLVVAKGGAALYVDFPKTNGPITVAEVESGKVRPILNLFERKAVINWRIETVDTQKRLTFAVIQEIGARQTSEFETEFFKQYRVLRLRDFGYTVQLYTEDKDGNFTAGPELLPKRADGRAWEKIPLFFIGSENNDELPDNPPLYDLAVLNIAHYRNSADYEEACFQLGQPTVVVSGLTESWAKEILGDRITLGSRSAIPLPVGATANLLQVAPNTMPAEAMDKKEKQMVALGAKLVEQRDVRQTATEASQNEASETSVLATSANNVSSAYKHAIGAAFEFLVSGEPKTEIKYKLNTEFERRMGTAQDRAQLVAEWQSNAITTEEMRAALTKLGVAFLPVEQYRDEIESQGPDLGTPVKRHELNAEAQKNASKGAAK